MATASWSSWTVRVRWGYFAATQQELPCHAVAAEYPQCTFTATPTCSSHSGTALCKFIVGQTNLDVSFVIKNYKVAVKIIVIWHLQENVSRKQNPFHHLGMDKWWDTRKVSFHPWVCLFRTKREKLTRA